LATNSTVHIDVEHVSFAVLAEYAAGRVFENASLKELEEHLLLCADCQRVAVQLDRDASKRGRPLEITHTTTDGPIRLWVEQSASGRWQARYTGPNLNGGQEFGRVERARTFVLKSFDEMFPDHLCSDACSFSR
jgi:hypothetical protein